MVRPVFPLPQLAHALVGAPRSYALSAHEPSASTLAMLSASPAQSDRALAQVLVNARKAYGAYVATGASINVCAGGDNGNGGQPILTLLPAGFDHRKPATVHTHYHGNNATVTEDAADWNHFQKRIVQTQKANPQLVYVLPECANPPATYSRNTPAFDCKWDNATSQRLATATALRAVSVSAGETVVSAHSRAYRVLSAVCQAENGRGLSCDRLELLDCLYVDCGDLLAAWAATPSGQACKSVRYYFATNEVPKAAKLKDAFGDRYVRKDLAMGADGHARTRGYMHTV